MVSSNNSLALRTRQSGKFTLYYCDKEETDSKLDEKNE